MINRTVFEEIAARGRRDGATVVIDLSSCVKIPHPEQGFGRFPHHLLRFEGVEGYSAPDFRGLVDKLRLSQVQSTGDLTEFCLQNLRSTDGAPLSPSCFDSVAPPMEQAIRATRAMRAYMIADFWSTMSKLARHGVTFAFASRLWSAEEIAVRRAIGNAEIIEWLWAGATWSAGSEIDALASGDGFFVGRSAPGVKRRNVALDRGMMAAVNEILGEKSHG